MKQPTYYEILKITWYPIGSVGGYISFLLDWLGTPYIGRAAHANHETVDVKNTWFVPVSLTFGFGT